MKSWKNHWDTIVKKKNKWSRKQMHHLICFSTKTHKKVIRFYVSMQKTFWVHKLYPRNLVIRNHNVVKENVLKLIRQNTKLNIRAFTHRNVITIVTIWSANSKTLLSENFLPQYTNKSSRLGPSKSRTSTLSSPSIPDHFMPGIPPKKTHAQSN